MKRLKKTIVMIILLEQFMEGFKMFEVTTWVQEVHGYLLFAIKIWTWNGWP